LCNRADGAAIDLLLEMLRFLPSERTSAEEALHHKYFDGFVPPSLSSGSLRPSPSTLDFIPVLSPAASSTPPSTFLTEHPSPTLNGFTSHHAPKSSTPSYSTPSEPTDPTPSEPTGPISEPTDSSPFISAKNIEEEETDKLGDGATLGENEDEGGGKNGEAELEEDATVGEHEEKEYGGEGEGEEVIESEGIYENTEEDEDETETY
jgi:serine/threonine protein kinase